MEQVQLPEGYHSVMPYLIVPNAAGFMEFAQTVFGATEKMKTMRDDNTIMHGEIYIGDSTVMFAQSSEQFPPQPAGMFICVADADVTYKKALAAGASSIMPPADQNYGRACGVVDPNGNSWWITTVKVN